MRMKKVGVRELEEKVRAGRPAPLRVGATDNPNRRADQYKNEKEEGNKNKKKYSENAKMYYAETSNMNYAENRLLDMCGSRGVCRRNAQMSSNMPEDPGYVYAIFP